MKWRQRPPPGLHIDNLTAIVLRPLPDDRPER